MKNDYIYLDNSATTPLCDEAKAAMTAAMECFGNPSSLHPAGVVARTLLEDSRAAVFHSLGLRGIPAPGELIFTASGTEADNLAVIGTAHAKERRRGGTILSTDSEHPAVENALVSLEKEGFSVIRIPTREGVLDFDFYAKALAENRVFLVSMMLANNETGALYDVARAFRMAKAKDHDIVTHTDAVQAYLKTPFTPKSLSADLITLSSHKIHGPKGVGALYVSAEARKRRDLVPVIHGGGQEAGFRSGTENLVGIAGFAAAAKVGQEQFAENVALIAHLRELAEELLAPLPIRLNLPRGNALPNILNLTLPAIRSETMLHELSKDGICVSQGSACSSHDKQHTSRALLSFGLSPEEAASSLRLSFSRENTEEDVRALATSLSAALEKLVRVKR